MNFLLLIFCVLLWNSVQAELFIIFEEADCKDTDDEYIAPGSCEIVVNGDGSYGTDTITTHLEIIKQAPDNTRVKTKLFGISMGEYTNDIGLDVDIDFCEMSRDPKSIAQPFIKAFGMTTSDCPLKPGVYGVENYSMDNANLPDSFPSGRYLLIMSLVYEEHTMITVDLYLTVE